ncbi:FAD-dependent monooxygenase [Sphaerisporangium perillae]|uniref:FAD-dependent monooxygenase n=1 Tax=Sphaerisporangium perillae TaxID=2935860 RepID=UPI002435DEB0|nr:FAD-dependent monooxygenase [Sphaerisporangium perillae]
MPADVVIAGGGPNGLMLACELSLAGVRPIVLERLPGRSEDNRANGLVGQVVRMLDRRGLYQSLSGGQEPPRPGPGYVFGALPLDLSVLEDNPLYNLMVPQRRVEQVLEERATDLGVEIRRGHQVTGLSQDADADAVTVDVEGPDGAYRLSTRYLVGADGGRSLTRKLSGIGFPGVTTDDVISRTAHATVPAAMIDPATGGLNVPGYGIIPPFMHHRTERGLFVFGPFPSGPTLISTTERGSAEAAAGPSLTLDELRESVRRVLGADLPLGPPEGEGPHLLRRVTGGNTRLADRFRDRRVLLVGDAAHVHTAIGGPGLNLGLQDTVNLGWKLAAEIRGWAPAGLLDSYEVERRPVAERVVMSTQAQSALIAPGSEVTALRQLFTELLREPRNVQHIADMMSGADVHYDMGTGAHDMGTGAHGLGTGGHDKGIGGGDRGTGGGDAEAGRAHPLIGRWAPDLLLDTGTGPVRLAELTRNARPLLLDLTEDRSLAVETSGWHDRVDTVTARPVDAATPVTAVLLRPDCYIAWASASPRPASGERETLHAALARWFGAPVQRGTLTREARA